MSIEEKRREAFEARIKISHPDDYAEYGERIFKREGCGYDWYWVNKYWLCWNDALDSVVVDLPKDVTNVTWPAYEQARDDILEAIESAGLKVKS